MARSEIKNERTSLGIHPKAIVLAPLHDLIVKNTVYQPRWLRASYRYDWAEIEDYYYHALGMVYLPFHYFCGLISDDYVALVGAPLTNRSSFLHTLAAVNAIPSLYADSILIVVQEDYREEPVDRRMMAYLSNYVISPLMKLYGLGQERIAYIDEILVPDFAASVQKISDKRRHWDIELSKYWDKNQLLFQLRNFSKA